MSAPQHPLTHRRIDSLRLAVTRFNSAEPESRDERAAMIVMLGIVENLVNDWDHAATTCQQCRQGFIPTRSDARYCTDLCRVQAHRERVPPRHRRAAL